jgi:hypothetical protein
MYLIDRAIRFFAAVIVCAGIFATVGVVAPAKAQNTQPLTADAFLANPSLLLQQYPNGGSLMIANAQQIVLTNPATFKLMLGLLQNANELQRGALGESLAQAAKVEVLTDQTLAADWQQQIAAINDPTFQTAATNAFGDVQLGAIGGGPLGSAGGGPGGIGGGGGGPQNIGAPGAFTQPFAFTGSTVGASGVFGSTTTTTNTSNRSVSP